jgi:ElaB/YqjD/DUF883 family membrane-anchored ribosome-binding protein
VAQEPFAPLMPPRGSRPATGAADHPDQIKGAIARTRTEMRDTLGQIQERLRPEHLIQQARTTVTQAATAKVRTIMHSAEDTAVLVAGHTNNAARRAAHYVRLHPLQTALVVGGVAWWLLRGRDRATQWDGASDGWQDHEGYGSDAGSTLSQATAAAGEAATQAAARVKSAARTATGQARKQWARASASVDSFVHDNPLAAGAIALAVGAAVGLAVPGTRIEDRTLGETRDQAMEQARRAALGLANTVTDRVEQATETSRA